MSEPIKIAVVGSGYVGLVAAVCFAEMGHNVICVDNDERKVSALQGGDTLIHESHLPELLQRYRNTRVRFMTDLGEATRTCQAIFVAVGTPQSETGDADLSYVEAVASEIARSVNGYKVIIEKSTVPVYTNEWIRRVIERNGVSREMFDVVSNPEFLREGTAVEDFLHPDRIVVGADSERAAALLSAIYAPLTDGSYYAKPNGIPGCCSGLKPPPLAADVDQERGDYQACVQRFSGAEDLVHQRGVEFVRGGRRQRGTSGAWDWTGFPDWAEVFATGHWVWRIVLSERCRGVSISRRTDGRGLQPVDRSREDQRQPEEAVPGQGAVGVVDAARQAAGRVGAGIQRRYG